MIIISDYLPVVKYPRFHCSKISRSTSFSDEGAAHPAIGWFERKLWYHGVRQLIPPSSLSGQSQHTQYCGFLFWLWPLKIQFILCTDYKFCRNQLTVGCAAAFWVGHSLLLLQVVNAMQLIKEKTSVKTKQKLTQDCLLCKQHQGFIELDQSLSQLRNFVT